MSTSVNTIQNQSLFDIVIQFTGQLSSIFEVAFLNGMSITDELTPGSKVLIPEYLLTNDIAQYLRINGIKPATSPSVEAYDLVTGCQGIECWIIDVDFIIS